MYFVDNSQDDFGRLSEFSFVGVFAISDDLHELVRRRRDPAPLPLPCKLCVDEEGSIPRLVLSSCFEKNINVKIMCSNVNQ